MPSDRSCRAVLQRGRRGSRFSVPPWPRGVHHGVSGLDREGNGYPCAGAAALQELYPQFEQFLRGVCRAALLFHAENFALPEGPGYFLEVIFAPPEAV